MNNNNTEWHKVPGNSVKIPGFLLKTYQILQNPENQDIISWALEGNAFVVKKVNDFSEKILPLFFKHHNFSSFVRQLNSYGFHKSKTEKEENLFRHYLFKKDQIELLPRIKRKGKFNLQAQGEVVLKKEETEKNPQINALEGKFKKEQTSMQLQIQKLQKKNEALEKRLLLLVSQNCKQKKENKSLWREIQKNKEDYEQKIQKLVNLYLITKTTLKQESNQKPLFSIEHTKKTIDKSLKNKKPNSLNTQSKKIKKPEKSLSKSPHPQLNQKSPLNNQKNIEQEDKTNIDFSNYEHLFLWSSSSKHQHKPEELTFRDYLEDFGCFEVSDKRDFKEGNAHPHFFLNEKSEDNEDEQESSQKGQS